VQGFEESLKSLKVVLKLKHYLKDLKKNITIFDKYRAFFGEA